MFFLWQVSPIYFKSYSVNYFKSYFKNFNLNENLSAYLFCISLMGWVYAGLNSFLFIFKPFKYSLKLKCMKDVLCLFSIFSCNDISIKNFLRMKMVSILSPWNFTFRLMIFVAKGKSGVQCGLVSSSLFPQPIRFKNILNPFKNNHLKLKCASVYKLVQNKWWFLFLYFNKIAHKIWRKSILGLNNHLKGKVKEVSVFTIKNIEGWVNVHVEHLFIINQFEVKLQKATSFKNK